MRRQSRNIVLLSIPVAIAQLFFGSTVALAAAANAPCQDVGAAHTFAGAQTSHALVSGAEASISYFASLLCTSTGTSTDDIRGTFTWVGVEIPGSGGAIVQIGLGKCKEAPNPFCDGTYKMFYAWGRPAGGGCVARTPAPAFLGAAPTGTHTYTVVRTSTKVSFKLDGVEQTSIPIANVACWTGTASAFVGEVWDRGDQLGGVVASHQQMRIALEEQAVGAAWASPGFSSCNTPNQNPSIYKCSRVGARSLDLWTDRS
jgi:hypothetical protein